MPLWACGSVTYTVTCSTMRLRREENQRREAEDTSHSLLSRSKCLLVAAVLFLLLRFDALTDYRTVK